VTENIDFKGYTILIVDDNPTNLGVVVSYLEAYHFDIIVARSGKNALKRMQYAQPDIILMDVMMPGIDGFETCRRLKAHQATQDVPIIFMTALTSTEDKLKGFEVGGVDYVTKPIQQEELLARVTTHLRIRDLTQRLQKTNADKDKFFSILAHDLKGPFLPVLGVAELLPKMADKLTPDDIRQMGDVIYKSARNVYNLLENLLQWSRLQMGVMVYEPSQLNLQQIGQQNVDLLASNAAIKGVLVQNNIPPDVWVFADVAMLNTVFRNLISNALKFTTLGRQVTIGMRKGEDTNGRIGEDANEQPRNIADSPPCLIEVTVSDTGVGMTEEVRQSLFKLGQHHSTLGTASEEGTGLGLIICQEMMNKSGGQIWVESILGKGTTVRFTVLGLETQNI